MDIIYTTQNGLKLKGKSATLAVNPVSGVVDATAILLIGKNHPGKLDKDVLLFQGPGEYEVGGVKITGIRGEDTVAFTVLMDGITLLLGDTETLVKVQNKIKEPDIIVMRTDSDADVAFVSAFEPHVALFYGDAAETAAAKLSQENVTKVSKFSATRDKLPQELQVCILG